MVQEVSNLGAKSPGAGYNGELNRLQTKKVEVDARESLVRPAQSNRNESSAVEQIGQKVTKPFRRPPEVETGGKVDRFV